MKKFILTLFFLGNVIIFNAQTVNKPANNVIAFNFGFTKTLQDFKLYEGSKITENVFPIIGFNFNLSYHRFLTDYLGLGISVGFDQKGFYPKQIIGSDSLITYFARPMDDINLIIMFKGLYRFNKIGIFLISGFSIDYMLEHFQAPVELFYYPIYGALIGGGVEFYLTKQVSITSTLAYNSTFKDFYAYRYSKYKTLKLDFGYEIYF